MHNAATLGSENIGARNLARLAHHGSTRGDYAIAAVCVGSLALAAMWWSKPVAHWFLLPVMACGILSGVDIVRWLRGRLDLFDPKTVIACLAFYGFFVAPILHVIWDRFGVGYDLILFGDWRPWLGAAAALCALGLLVYRPAHNFVFSHTQPSATSWEFHAKKFYPVFGFFLFIAIRRCSHQKFKGRQGQKDRHKH